MMKNKVGPVAVYMSKELLNGMLCCLDYLIAIDEQQGEWEKHAQRIKDKILKYGRRFANNSEDCVAICFYENEAAVLIKAFSLYVILTRNPTKDYYEVMQRSMSDVEEHL